MKILSVVGARPQFVKLAAVCRAVQTASDVDHVIVHTGQHYDALMSDVFFEGLQIPQPDVNLGIGSRSHGAQTGAMLGALDPLLEQQRPDWTLVYGDTNSTIAGALAAVKLHVPVAHLEAGLRSHNRRMAEEHNRVLTDHAADLLLAPTERAMDNLAIEGLARRAVLTGDVMVDICRAARDLVHATAPRLPRNIFPDDRYVLATIHRADNTDDGHRLRAIVEALQELSTPVVLVAHPRLLARAAQLGVALDRGAVRIAAPLPYFEMVSAVMGAAGVVTDSGGLQKEAYLLGTPCTTVRTETEWVETLVDDWNVLDPSLECLSVLAARERPHSPQPAPFGDGRAAERVLDALMTWSY